MRATEVVEELLKIDDGDSAVGVEIAELLWQRLGEEVASDKIKRRTVEQGHQPDPPLQHTPLA